MPNAHPTAREAAADGVVALGSWISLHTGNPTTTAGTEATGGAPAYARQQTTWPDDTTDDGIVTGSQVIIDVPPGDYTFYGINTAAVGGVCVIAAPIPLTSIVGQGRIKVTPKVAGS